MHTSQYIQSCILPHFVAGYAIHTRSTALPEGRGPPAPASAAESDRSVCRYEHPFTTALERLPGQYPAWMLQPRQPTPAQPLERWPCTHVDTPEALSELAAHLESVREFAVDLEHSDRYARTWTDRPDAWHCRCVIRLCEEHAWFALMLSTELHQTGPKCRARPHGGYWAYPAVDYLFGGPLQC
jgi:hypothetical protein